MTYDATAQKLAVKTIGTVESSMGWHAINYSDPITVGIAQWYGTRAAALLNRMKLTSSWSGVEPSLNSDLSTVPQDDTAWTTRYLTAGEGASIVPVLDANQVIQTDQFVRDLDAYRVHAVSLGMDPNTDTDAMIMFFTAYHQGPVYANNAFAAAAGTPHPTLVQMRDAILADPVLGAYTSRYNTAYSIISAHDVSGVPDFGTAPGTPPPTTGGGGASSSTAKTVKFVQIVGDGLRITLDTGTVECYPNGSGYFIPRTGANAAPPPVTGPTPPTPPTGTWVDPLPTGIVTSLYGPRTAPPGTIGASFHWGLDLSTPGYAGTIYAPADGVIKIATDNGNATAGTYVKMWTDDGLYTLNFYHMLYGSLKVTAGQHVTAGQPLGIEGATGNVTGQHLHFEVYSGQYADPWPGYPVNPVNPVPVLAAHGVYR